MKPNVHKQSLDAALAEAAGLIAERDALDQQVERLNRKIQDLVAAVEGLAPLCGIDAKKEYAYLFPYDMEPEVGFTDAIRKVLSTVPMNMYTAVGVRDELIKSGFDVDKYTNPMASVHTILKRLVENSEVLTYDEEGKTVYCWNPVELYRKRLKDAAKAKKKSKR
jgi:hypothetical protein